MEKKSIMSEGHRQRLKERYVRCGLDGLEEYEMLELLLFYLIPRRDCKPIAKKLLEEFGTIANVLYAKQEELLNVSGIGASTFHFFNLIKDINLLTYKESQIKEKKFISSTSELLEYLKMDLFNLKKEIFKVIFLDVQNRFICDEIISEGTIDKNYLYPREIIERTIRYNAKNVIFVHNHPSGNLMPSQSDKIITEKLKIVLENIDVKLLDHVIISNRGYFSFLENELL